MKDLARRSVGSIRKGRFVEDRQLLPLILRQLSTASRAPFGRVFQTDGPGIVVTFSSWIIATSIAGIADRPDGFVQAVWTGLLGLIGPASVYGVLLAKNLVIGPYKALNQLTQKRRRAMAILKSHRNKVIFSATGWHIYWDTRDDRLTFRCENAGAQFAGGVFNLTWVVTDPIGRTFGSTGLSCNHVFVGGSPGRTFHCVFPLAFAGVPAGYEVVRGRYRVRCEARPDLTRPPVLLCESEGTPEFPTGIRLVFEDVVDGNYRAVISAPTHEQHIWRTGIRSRWDDSPNTRTVIESVTPPVRGLMCDEALRLKGHYPMDQQSGVVTVGTAPSLWVDVICYENWGHNHSPSGDSFPIKIPYAVHGETEVFPDGEFVMTVRATSGTKTSRARFYCERPFGLALRVRVECLPDAGPEPGELV